MPLTRCTLPTGSKGWRWGTKGKCYSDKKKALAQGFAESKGDEAKFKEELAKSSVQVTAAEIEAAMQPEPEPGFGNRYLDSALAYISKTERDAMPESDFAGPDRSYPIKDQKHLDAAVKLLGRAPKGEQAAIKKRIKEIAKRKGLSLPKSWEGEK